MRTHTHPMLCFLANNAGQQNLIANECLLWCIQCNDSTCDRGIPLLWTPLGQIVLIKGGVLISVKVSYTFLVAGTMHSVLIKGSVLISWVSF